GFQLDGDSNIGYDRMKAKVNEELKKHFRPEFLNRIDDTIVFPALSRDELLQIVELFVKRLRDRLLDRDMSIELSDTAKERLLELGWDQSMGARPLRRAMQQWIEDPLSELILDGTVRAG